MRRLGDHASGGAGEAVLAKQLDAGVNQLIGGLVSGSFGFGHVAGSLGRASRANKKVYNTGTTPRLITVPIASPNAMAQAMP